MSGPEGKLRLSGARVLVTRPRERARELCFLLEDEGAEVIALPLLELLPPEDERPLRSAAEQIHQYAWIAFASPSAVRALVGAAQQAGTLDRLAKLKVAVVGPGTGTEVEAHGLTVAKTATVNTGAGLAQALLGAVGVDEQVLLPAAQQGRPELEDGLRRAGIRVARVVAYRSEQRPVDKATLEALASNPPEVLLFASPRAVTAFFELLVSTDTSRLKHSKFVAIGPTTASALTRLGVTVAAVAERPTSEALVDAAVRAVGG
jgi:uroporphyrinogen-III synthase